MFPLVHIWSATKVLKKKTPLLVIGSVLPDMVWVDRENFPPEKLHDNLDEFYSFLESNDKNLLDLALGMKLHSNKVGTDKYSHIYKGGYSYVRGKELIPDLKRLLGSVDGQKISDLSHNFIEAALDINLLKTKPEILTLYKNSLSNVNLVKVSKVISDFSKIDPKIVSKDVHILFNVVNPDNLTSDKLIAKEVLPKMIKFGFGKEVDDEEVLSILRKAIKLTENEYKDLFNEMISGMKIDFPENK